MDPAGREEVLELCRDLARNKGMSLLFSSHLLPDVEAVCDHVVVLGGGRLLAAGRIEDLKKRHDRWFEVRVKGDQRRVRRPAGGAGLRGRAAGGQAARRAARRAQTPDALWEAAARGGRADPPAPAPAAARSRKCFSKPWRSRLMPIFDQGYQHWHGKLSGHAWRWLAITRHGVASQLRTACDAVVFTAWFPALALAAFLIVWGLIEQQSAKPRRASLLPILPRARSPTRCWPARRRYRAVDWTMAFHYFFCVEMFFSMLLVLLVGPNLISQDLRFNAIPLYFSRPVRRLDYFLGKLGVIAAFLAAVSSRRRSLA